MNVQLFYLYLNCKRTILNQNKELHICNKLGGSMNYSKTFKKIRIAKGMKLKEAAGNTLSISQLSRFENEQSMISIDSFIELLKNVNTSPEEYFYLLRKEENELKKYFNIIKNLLNNRKYDKLEELAIDLKNQKPTSNSWMSFLVLFVDSIIILDKEKRILNQPRVLSYLMKVEDWGEMELYIYAIFGFVFDVETTYLLMKTAIKKSRLYQSIPQDMNLLFSILSNNFSTFILHKRYDYAEETLAIFEKKLSENTLLIEPHLDFLFNKGILDFTQEKEEKAKEHCEQVFELCRLFKLTEQEENYRKRYLIWSKSYLDPDFQELIIKIGFIV
ncbi:MAG: helix-turn-helix domain-containing protein [Carnobacterium jeotgali]|uniref:Rgg/GadR/MutR family transcriptional regulator n=2 Tax=Carnobacterium jeotgali TaxID=545534 RepID=UPI003C78898E